MFILLFLSSALLLIPSTGCGHCREISSTFNQDIERWLATESAGNQEHIRVSLSEDVITSTAADLADGLQDAVRERIPRRFRVLSMDLTTETSLELDSFRLSERPDSVGLDLGMTISLGVGIPSGRNRRWIRSSADLNARVDLELIQTAAGTGVALDFGDAEVRLGDLRLGSVPSLLRSVRGPLRSGIEDLLELVEGSSVLDEIGLVVVAEFSPIQLGDTEVELIPSSIGYVARSRRVEIGLSSNLPIAGQLSFPAPLRDAAVSVAVPEQSGIALINAVLAGDGGLQFDARGRTEANGEYRMLVSELDPNLGGLDFVYRVYRCAAPCLMADFGGRAQVGFSDGLRLLISDHHLVSASRFEGAVESRQPDAERLSEKLTELLSDLLVSQIVELPLGRRHSLGLSELEVAPAGYAIGRSHSRTDLEIQRPAEGGLGGPRSVNRSEGGLGGPRSRELETGNWKLGTGNWELGTDLKLPANPQTRRTRRSVEFDIPAQCTAVDVSTGSRSQRAQPHDGSREKKE